MGGAILRDAHLVNANLIGTKLHHAYLSGANLRQANLRGAMLSSAELTHTDLTKTSFGETVLSDLNLASVIGLETCQHLGPSALDHRTFKKSGPLPIPILRGIGLSERLIEYLPSIFNQAIQYYSYFISYSTKDKEFAGSFIIPAAIERGETYTVDGVRMQCLGWVFNRLLSGAGLTSAGRPQRPCLLRP